MGGLALLAAVVGVGVMSLGTLIADPGDPGVAVARQQQRLAEMDRQVELLLRAPDVAASAEARRRLAETVSAFDRTLAALLAGGDAVRADGGNERVAAVDDPAARRALRRTAALWRRTGAGLADLAAGATPVDGAAGRLAVTDFHDDGPVIARELALAGAALADWRPSVSLRSIGIGLLAAGALLLAAGALAEVRVRPTSRPANSPAAAAAPSPPPAAEPRRAQPAAPAVPTPPYAPERDDGPAGERGSLVAFRKYLGREAAAATELEGGALLLRNANHAASYASLVARELEECVRDATKVMDRVNQIAAWTEEAADQFSAETQATEPADPPVAAATRRVTRLTTQTSETAADIEHTVAALLCRTRQYEEDVGRILGHVTSIHRSTKRLGRAFEWTQPAAEPPAPPALPAAPADPPPAAASDPVPEAESEHVPYAAPFAIPPETGEQDTEPSADEVADATAAAIEDFMDRLLDAEPPAGPSADGDDEDPPPRA